MEFTTMATPKFIDRILNLKKGSFVTVAFKRAAKVRKNQTPLFKVWKGVVRPGITYDNIGAVQEGRENGTLPGENAGLPYGVWHTFPYVIEHNGEFHYRWTMTGGKTLDSHYEDENGNIISAENAREICLASEFPTNKGPVTVMNTKEVNLTEINGENLE
jgi:hypothetical protein